MREAPALVIIDGLLERGAAVRVHDPEALGVARRIWGDRLTYCDTNYEAAEGADALLIVTEWKQYRNPDFPRIRQLLGEPILFDGRNLFDPEHMRAQGFEYFSVGRPAAMALREANPGA